MPNWLPKILTCRNDLHWPSMNCLGSEKARDDWNKDRERLNTTVDSLQTQLQPANQAKDEVQQARNTASTAYLEKTTSYFDEIRKSRTAQSQSEYTRNAATLRGQQVEVGYKVCWRPSLTSHSCLLSKILQFLQIFFTSDSN